MRHVVARPDRAHGTGAPSPATSRQAALAAEAQRLGRRLVIAEVVAFRSLNGARGIRGDAAIRLCTKTSQRARDLRLRFHRAIDHLVKAEGFEEALRIFRERQHEVSRRVRTTEAQGFVQVRQWTGRGVRSS